MNKNFEFVSLCTESKATKLEKFELKRFPAVSFLLLSCCILQIACPQLIRSLIPSTRFKVFEFTFKICNCLRHVIDVTSFLAVTSTAKLVKYTPIRLDGVK